MGTCDDLGAGAFPATGVGAAVSPAGTPIPEMESFGSDRAVPVQTSTTTFDTNLSSFVKGDHAIVIYESDEAMDEEIACGSIGALTAQMAGIALFTADGPRSTLCSFLFDLEDVSGEDAIAAPEG